MRRISTSILRALVPKTIEATTFCPICLKPFRQARPQCVDHDHRTGMVRGVLCSWCNGMLGGLNDDFGWMTRAAEYLRNPPAIDHDGVVFVPDSPGAAGHLPLTGDRHD
jgi:hypothetical protein